MLLFSCNFKSIILFFCFFMLCLSSSPSIFHFILCHHPRNIMKFALKDWKLNVNVIDRRMARMSQSRRLMKRKKKGWWLKVMTRTRCHGRLVTTAESTFAILCRQFQSFQQKRWEEFSWKQQNFDEYSLIFRFTATLTSFWAPTGFLRSPSRLPRSQPTQFRWLVAMVAKRLRVWVSVSMRMKTYPQFLRRLLERSRRAK